MHCQLSQAVAVLRFGTYGSLTCFGETVFSESTDAPQIAQSNLSGGRWRSQYGWGTRSRRSWTRSYLWTPQQVSAADAGDINITISSVSGSVLGRIRTDVERPKLHSIEFTEDENGCADFTLRLNRLPNFEILPFAVIDVTIANTSYQWFSGVVTFVDEAGTRGGSFESNSNRPYEFRGFGRRRYIEQMRADTDFAALQDVGVVVKTLFRDYVVGVDEPKPFSPIIYAESKIETNTATVLASQIELGKFSLRQVFDTLSQMANARWGVDGDGETYFEQKTTVPVKTFFIGRKLNDFEPKISYENIKNAIIVQRQQGRGSGGAGWAVAGIYNNTSSVRKYGRNELVYQIPGYFDDADADIIGGSLRDSLSEPTYSAEISGIMIETAADKFRRGTYRFILPLDTYRDTVSDFDNASEFSVIGSGDLAVADDELTFVYADGSVKLTFQNAINQRAETNIYATGLIKEIRFYVQSSVTGALLQVGVGENQWDENTTDVDVQVRDRFDPFVWDVSNLNLRKLQKFGLKVKANQSQSVNVWIDKLDIIYRGHKTYTMELKRVTYSFTPQGSVARAEFGDLPRRLQEYVSGLMAATSSLKFVGEVR